MIPTIPIDLTPLANALVGVAAAVLSGFFIPWLRAKAGEARAANLMKWARIGVQAAEQLYQSKQNSGKDKYAYVEQFLARHGFKLEAAEVEQAIESAVFELTRDAVYRLPVNEQ